MTDLGPLLLAIVGVLYVGYEVRSRGPQRVRDSSGTLLFPLVRSLRFILAVASIVFSLGSYWAFRDASADWWVSVILFAVGGGALFTSSIIAVTSSGLESRRLLGLLITRFDWPNIESATVVPETGQIEVRSRDGKIIRHSRYHVDPERFLAELEERQVTVNRQGIF